MSLSVFMVWDCDKTKHESKKSWSDGGRCVRGVPRLLGEEGSEWELDRKEEMTAQN